MTQSNELAADNTKPTKLSDYLTTILTVLSGRIQMLMTGTMLSVGQPFPPALLATSPPNHHPIGYICGHYHDNYIMLICQAPGAG